MQAIALRNPAIASGFQLISLIRNPPADQRTEVSARRSADRFKLKRSAGYKEFPVFCTGWKRACRVEPLAQIALNTSEALWPPKPNELFMAVLIFDSRAVFGT